MHQARWIKWILPVGLAISPLLLMKALLDPDQTIRYLYLTILGTVMMTIMLTTYRRQFTQVFQKIIDWKNPLFIGILVWLIATVLSLNVALQKSEGLVEVARVVFLLITYICVLAWIRIDSKNIVYLSIGFCIVSFILSCIGISDLVESLSNASNANGYYQMTGNMGNRNLLAIMISLCLPFCFIAFKNYKSFFIRTILAAGFVLSVTVVCLTSSRVGWLGLVAMLFISVGAVVIAGIRKQIAPALFRKLLGALAAFVILLVLSIFILIKTTDHSKVIVTRLKSFYNFNSEKNIHTESINERLLLWSNSIQLVKDHPITGVGAGNWKFRYPEKSLAGRSAQGDVLFQQPHNDFLWVFSETGMIGGLAFTLLFVFTFIAALRTFFHKTPPASTLLSIVLLSGISMYAIHSFFDFPKERPLILFTFGCMLALASTLTATKNAQPASAKKLRIFTFLFAGIALMSMFFWYNRMQGEVNLKKALAVRKQGNYNKEKKLLSAMNPFFFESDLNGTPIDWYRGEADFRLGNLNESQKYFEASLKQSPYHLYSYYDLGAIYYYRKDIPAAIEAWRKALDIAPDFSDAAINLSSAYYNQGEFEKAASALSKAKIDYANKSNTSAVVSVLRQYVSLVKDTIKQPEIAAALEVMQNSDDSLINLQWVMRIYEKAPTEAAIGRAIYNAKTKRYITPLEADSLRTFYGIKKKK